MMSELTDKQVKFLAEFMGWKIDESQKCESGKPVWLNTRHPYQSYTTDALVDLAHLPSTEKAVMDRAEEKQRYITFRKIGNKGDCCTCVLEGDGDLYDHRGYGPTRFVALVNALMSAEGK